MSTFEVDVGQINVTPDQHVQNEAHFCLHGEHKVETKTKYNNKHKNNNYTVNINDDIEDKDDNKINISNNINYSTNRNKSGTKIKKVYYNILNKKEHVQPKHCK